MQQTPINLDRMLRAGKAMTHKKMLLSALFVHNELPIRLAKRVFELDSLPIKLLEEPAILKLRDDYLRSWKSVVDFPRFTSERDAQTPPTPEDEPRIPGYRLGERPTHEFIDSLKVFASIGPNLEGLLKPEMLPVHVLSQDRFLRLLQDIKWRHRADQVFMSLGMRNFRKSVPSMIFDHAGLQQFLDSFNRGRIGVRLLMGHQIAMTLDFVKGPKSMSTVGIIDVETDITKVVVNAWDMAAEVARRYYGPKLTHLPSYEIRTSAEDDRPTFTYIPTILHHMCFELFKNSIRATVESRGFGEDKSYPPLRIVVVGGKEDMIIKVSDQGLGVARLNLEKMNSYMGSTAPEPTLTFEDAIQLAEGVGQEPPFDDVRYYLPLAGFGYGMPISRLYAEYLGGHMEVISMEGYGTDAYLYLERLGSAVEQMSDATVGSIFDGPVKPPHERGRRDGYERSFG
ncbi:mitochondrial branched-chain alpha-ketoacid dehydrogenase kinase-domain-containing protein [Hyaloraphidium curvatum]|nr:mitochondrial branched-chain alpha-ketoacid dehydrogenase kinase-domain-containing protein [Hyaloraphidium curvatum]